LFVLPSFAGVPFEYEHNAILTATLTSTPSRAR
jgi:hypothetical protein